MYKGVTNDMKRLQPGKVSSVDCTCIRNIYIQVCSPVSGYNPGDLANGLSPLQVEIHDKTISYMFHLHQSTSCTL